jgi:arylsulfatase A-like enzyme
MMHHLVKNWVERAGRLPAVAALGSWLITAACSPDPVTAHEKKAPLPEHPNVLLVLFDDLNTAIEGLGGHPQARTPNLRRLMDRGVTFSNAHANSTICAPSRASMFSGLYPSTTGVYGFEKDKQQALIDEHVFLQEHLLANGYHVYGVGKLLHHEYFDFYTEYQRINPSAPHCYGPYPEREWGVHPSMEYIFDYVTKQELEKTVYIPGELTFAPLSKVPPWGWVLRGEQFRYASPDDRDKMPDERSVDYAIDVLHRNHDAPFFLGVGIIRPHSPLNVPDEYFDLFPLDQIELPPGYREHDLDDVQNTLADKKGFAWFDAYRKADAHDGMIDQDVWKRWIQAYLASVAFADAQIGRLLDSLEGSPYANDTVVVVTSDNGYHMGEKGYIFKHTRWDASTRVPLILAAPGLADSGVQCTKPVSLVDVYPTINDLCGLPSEPNVSGNGRSLDGHSLRPLLENPKAGVWAGPAVAITEISQGPFTSVRSERFRYVIADTETNSPYEELYDHTTDPHEWHNLANDPAMAAVKTELAAALAEVRANR